MSPEGDAETEPVSGSPDQVRLSERNQPNSSQPRSPTTKGLTTLDIVGSDQAVSTRIDEARNADSFPMWILADDIRPETGNALKLIAASQTAGT